jgi:hypothetical protein
MTEPVEWLRPVLPVLSLLLLHLGGAFVLRRLWRPSRRLRRGLVAAGLLAALGLVLPIVLTGSRHGQLTAPAQALRHFSMLWLTSVAAVACLGGAFLALRAALERLRRRSSAPDVLLDPSRRAAMTRVGQAVPVAAVAAGGFGLAEGANVPVLREVVVRVAGLPPAFDGFRIGQTTDVHVGPFVSSEDLRAAVARLDVAGVDLQVMTGDLIDDLSQLDATIAALASTRAPHGLVAILGNHEYWAGLKRVLAAYDEAIRGGAPLRLLVNESHVIEKGGARLRIVGVDYPMREFGRREEVMARIAEASFGAAPPADVTVCLSHHPDFFPHAARRGAALTLAGHTHGGQVSFLGLRPAALPFKYPLGEYALGASQLSVSAGTGHWMPYRVGTPAEITVLVLRRA